MQKIGNEQNKASTSRDYGYSRCFLMPHLSGGTGLPRVRCQRSQSLKGQHQASVSTSPPASPRRTSIIKIKELNIGTDFAAKSVPAAKLHSTVFGFKFLADEAS